MKISSTLVLLLFLYLNVRAERRIDNIPHAKADTCSPKQSITHPPTLEFNFRNDSLQILRVGTLSGFDTALVHFAIIIQPQHFNISDNVNGVFTYQPRQYVGKDRFVYRVCLNACKSICDTGTVQLDLYGLCIVPTIITPNNDGLNDRLLIPCLEANNFNDNELRIFNQWGDEVFHAAPYHNDWEGVYLGKPLPDGTYFFLFRQNKTLDYQRGYITIFR